MRKSWKRFISGFLLLASMITAWPVNQFVEAEELPVYEQEENLNANSTQQTAQTIYVNSTYADKLESSSDQNWYKFTVGNNGYISMDFSHDYIGSGGTYWTAYLYDENMKELTSFAFYGDKLSATTENIGIPLGTYYIRIGAYNYSAYEYQLKVNFTSSNAWETENNNDFASADNVSVNSAVNGSLMDGNDIDWFKFNINSAGTVNISFSRDYIGSGGTYWMMYIYDANVTELTNYSFSGDRMSDTRGKIGLPAGTYYIKIDDYNSSDLDYSFVVNYTQANNWETEVNNSLGTADVIDANMTKYGSLMSGADVDWYKYTVSKTGTITLRFSHDYVDSGMQYWRMQLYNSNGEEQESFNYYGNTTQDDEVLNLTSGVYYLKVQDYSYSDANYSILIIDPNASDTTKPTGSISTTNNVSSSQTVTLKLSDNKGIAGYYWGTSSSYGNNSYTATSSGNVTRTVSAPGTYYFTVRDTSGNVSSTYSVTFYRTTLNANGGSVSPSSVLTRSGNSFTLPTPKRSGYSYKGWATSSAASSGVKSVTPNGNRTYYAIWQKSSAITSLGKVQMGSFKNTPYGVHFEWKSVPNADTYNIYRKEGNGSWKQIASGVRRTVYTDATSVNWKKYYYTVRAVNGNTISQEYDETRWTTCIRALEKAEIGSFKNTPNGINISWFSVSGADSYQVSRRTENGDWKVIASSVRRTVYTDTTAVAGQKYYYAVRAVNGDVLSKTYDTNKKTTCIKELGAVILGTFSNVSDGVHLSWSAIPGADVYQVLRKEDGGDWQVLTSTVRRTVFTDTTAGKSRKYYYTVRAVNGDVISKTYTTSRWIICR